MTKPGADRAAAGGERPHGQTHDTRAGENPHDDPTARRRTRRKPLERGPGAHHAGAANVALVPLRRALGGHGDVHPRLHAGGQPDRGRHVVGAGGADRVPRQRHRAGADAAHRPRGREVRHSVCGDGARLVRHARGAPAGPDARHRRLRLVRHPDLVRRADDLHPDGRAGGP
ncbi:hypothetical protein D3C72_1317960 [compost metagenome]